MSSETEPAGRLMIARYADTPVVVNGVMDDTVWAKADGYRMFLGRDMISNTSLPGADTLWEEGEVRLAWDDKYLYVAVKCYDSDIVHEWEEDQTHLFREGDTVEIFLKPEESTWYWKIYATPTGRKTVYWYPGRGRMGLSSHFEKPAISLEDILLGIKIEGTLNDWGTRMSTGLLR